MVEALQNFPDRVQLSQDIRTGPGHWREWFSNPGPLSLELGTGKGQFLRQLATEYPDQCFIGIEKEAGVLLQAVRRTHELGLTNLRFLLADVKDLAALFAPAEIETLYINFCDPWPKSKHQKRRLTDVGFLQIYRVFLAAGGTVRFKTDNRALFDFSLESFSKADMDLLQVSFNLHAESSGPVFMTEYETKFVAAGMPIHYCVARFGRQRGEEQGLG